jgi:aryl-alcohol dehydrogenase-like predicted oxidoreductase
LFDRFAGFFHAFGSLEKGLRQALDEKRVRDVVYRLFGNKYDSLSTLLDRVSSPERKSSDEVIDSVERYVLARCADQLIRELKADYSAFWYEHRDDGKALSVRISDLTDTTRQSLLSQGEGIGDFLDWFDLHFIKLFKVATVQNRYNLVDRGSEDVLNYCEKHGIGFIPWYPLAAGRLAESGSILDDLAKAHGATPSQIALAWVLKRSPVMLPIPGTSKVAHLEENVAAVDIPLSDAEFDALDRDGRTEYQQS